MFIGREKELAALEKMYNKENFQLAIVYGRRRVGKTSILNEFIKNKKSLYLPAEEVNDVLNLKKFSKILGELLEIDKFPTVDNWHDFFSIVKTKFGQEKLVVIIDEYPYAANANKSLNSILQHVIDYQLKESNIFMVLCGSSMSFMENQVLGEKSPLFGRRTGQIKVNPLDYYDAAKFYPNVSDEDKVRYYSTVGGTPYYLSLITEDLTFEQNIKELYFEISGYLLNEGTLLMKQEFRDPALYNAILQAIASGCVSLNEIVGFTKLESNLISKYLVILQDLNYLDRVVPFGNNALKGKKSQYHITENFITFWYRYVFPFKGEIERGYGDIYWTLAINSLNEHIGIIFEEISLQYLRRVNSEKGLPFIAKYFGKWWGKGASGEAQEVDVVVESIDNRELIIGECKWSSTFKINQVIELLMYRESLFFKYKTYKYLFTKTKINNLNKGITNITLSELYKT